MSDRERRWSLHRAHPIVDLTQRKPVSRALALASVQTLGLGVLFFIYWLFDIRDSVVESLMYPPVVSFLLVLATSNSRLSRPLRVVTAYVIAGTVGCLFAELPGPVYLEATIAGGLTMFLMLLVGVFHAPATAIPLIMVITFTTGLTALVALPLVILLGCMVVFLAWGAHRILGDADYPQGWW